MKPNNRPEISIIMHDIRSCHNVGSLLRTAEGLGVSHVYFTGYTPYPATAHDERLPHIAAKMNNQIHKTALGAEVSVPWTHEADIVKLIEQLKSSGATIAALEQTKDSLSLPRFTPPQKITILLGREVEGVDHKLLDLCDIALEIPMFGHKESFNVVEATAMALYHCRFYPFS